MRRSFTKMHGCGNDYVYFNCMEQPFLNPEEASIRLSDRHKSVGGDGIILVLPSEVADAKMRIFNADGSEGKMCGNGIRCVGKFLYDYSICTKTTLQVETLSGIKTLQLQLKNGTVDSVTVDMGQANLTPASLPVLLEGQRIVNQPITVDGKPVSITCVSMGNPHCVVFVEDPSVLPLEVIGPPFEKHVLFPEGVNTEFITVHDRRSLTMRVWERGSGETMACGTGACAAAVAAVENGYCDKNEDITVHLRGGDLKIRYTDDTVYMTGEAVIAFEGTVEL